MSISKGLEQLGFVSDKDFVLQDNGNGVEIRDWNSNKLQPSMSEIESAKTEWIEEQNARPGRLASAKSKLEALGLTTEEVEEAFGI
tara:strand:+ start:559 stop:816 length:258 start_codon:yes stop_codon:yes gene_type:complete